MCLSLAALGALGVVFWPAMKTALFVLYRLLRWLLLFSGFMFIVFIVAFGIINVLQSEIGKDAALMVGVASGLIAAILVCNGLVKLTEQSGTDQT